MNNLSVKLIALVFGLGLYSDTSASHIYGGEMSYTITTKNKLVVKAVMYRDCRGIAMGASDFKAGYHAGINAGKGCSTVNMTLTRTAIKDITPFCGTQSKPCNPSNTYGTGEGIEAHYFVFDTIDLNSGNIKTYINGTTCCEITFFISATGRNGAITTGQAGNSFYLPLTINFCNLNKCKNKFSSGPAWSPFKSLWVCCNQSATINSSAFDADEDNLKYKLCPALSAHATSASYSSPFTYVYPVTPYCVPPNTIKCSPNITTNPFRGQFLDSLIGHYYYTPTKCDEVAVLAVKCEESRTDTNGNLLVISSTYRDFQVVVRDDCGYNKSPVLTGIPVSARVCSGDKLSIPFTMSDEPFTPYQTKRDTPTASYSGNFKNATLKFKDPYSRVIESLFQWSSDSGLSTISKRLLTITADDNHCPKPAVTIKSSTISIYPKISDTIQLAVSTDSCSGITANILNDSLFKGKGFEFDWEVYNLDSGRIYLTKTSAPPLKLNSIPKGNYAISVSAFSSQNCMQKTSSVHFVVPGFYGQILLGKDTSYCVNSKLEIIADVSGVAYPVKYNWEYTLASKVPVTKNDTNNSIQLIQPNYNIIVKSLLITDKNNCSIYNNNAYTISPKTTPVVNLGNDTTICENDILQLKVPIYLGEKYKWNTGDTIYTIWVQKAGTFSLKINHTSGCSASDTIVVSEAQIPEIVTQTKTSCNLDDSIDLNSLLTLDGINPSGQAVNYKKYSLNSDTQSLNFKNLTLYNGSIFSNNAAFGLWKFKYVVNNPACPLQEGFLSIPHYSIPKAAFTTGNTVIAGDKLEVPFINQSTNADLNPLSYLWTFDGGTPATSAATNPLSKYPLASGFYNVKLIASTAYCSDSTEKEIELTFNSIPNHSKQILITPDLRLLGKDINKVELTLRDACGRSVLLNNNNEGINEFNLPDGIYFYNLNWIENGNILNLFGKIVIPFLR